MKIRRLGFALAAVIATAAALAPAGAASAASAASGRQVSRGAASVALRPSGLPRSAPGEIRNRQNRGCVDVVSEEGFLKPGTHIQMYHCTGAIEQQWIVPPIDASDTIFELISERSGLCVTGNFNASPGTLVTQQLCSTSFLGDLWRMLPVSTATSTYFMQNAATGLCADIVNGSTADHARIEEMPCNGDKSQQFVF